jgi:hypothetical protein
VLFGKQIANYKRNFAGFCARRGRLALPKGPGNVHWRSPTLQRSQLPDGEICSIFYLSVCCGQLENDSVPSTRIICFFLITWISTAYHASAQKRPLVHICLGFYGKGSDSS